MATAWQGKAIITAEICGYVSGNASPICGQPADYEIDFGWKNGNLAAACAEHAALARHKFTVKWIKSLPTTQDTGRPLAADDLTLDA